MKRGIVAVLMMLSSTSVFCQDWVELAGNENVRYDGRAGTRVFGKTKTGIPIVIVQGRIFDKRKSSYSYQKWYVSVNDCKTGYGKLVTLQINGDFEFENDFVANGGSMASAVADMLCYPVKEQTGKGV